MFLRVFLCSRFVLMFLAFVSRADSITSPHLLAACRTNTELPLGLHNTGARTRAPLCDAWAARGARVWLSTLPTPQALYPHPPHPPLPLDSCTGAVRASCWWKIICQSLRWHCGNLFSPNVTFKWEGAGCSHIIVLKQRSPGQLNEAPIMNAMIKFPPGASNNSLLTSPHL